MLLLSDKLMVWWFTNQVAARIGKGLEAPIITEDKKMTDLMQSYHVREQIYEIYEKSPEHACMSGSHNFLRVAHKVSDHHLHQG